MKKFTEAILLTMLLLFMAVCAGYGKGISLPKGNTEAEGMVKKEIELDEQLTTRQEDQTENENVQSDFAAASTEEEVTLELEIPDSYVIDNFPIIYQMPELPTGCEITALTMVLDYYGFIADKVEMAERYLPTLYSTGIYYGEDGRAYGNDINQYFIGNPQTEEGIICGTGAIVTAANSFLEENGSSIRAIDKTGVSLEELYRLVSQNVPVIVWCTIGMVDRVPKQGWYTESGEYVDWGRNDHGAVLIGYSENTVTIADPISGQVEYDKTQFESVFASRQNRCVILQE